MLVTGATGFLGGRLVERLVLGHGAHVRALVSSFARCARLARFPAELHRGDLLDADAVRRAAEGCEVIFHCGYGSRGDARQRRRVNVEGTQHVLRAARVGGARVVHVSTQMVYGLEVSGELDEGAGRSGRGGTYAKSKLEAEERALAAAAEGLEVVVLQPTAVYGPFAPVWTVGVLERLRTGRVALADGGQGPCNAVYVDDAVTALLLAASAETAAGQRFLVSADRPVTWRAFYGHYERMLDLDATVPMSTEEARRLATPRPRRGAAGELLGAVRHDPELRARLRRSREGAWAARLLRRLRPPRSTTPEARSEPPELRRLRELRAPAPERTLHPPSEAEIALQTQGARVRIDKAQRLLGYRPAFDLDAGMKLTGAWARWAGLAPADPEQREER